MDTVNCSMARNFAEGAISPATTSWPPLVMRRWFLLACSVCGLGLFFLAPRLGRADQDLRWQWRTIETDHFRIHYYQGLEATAQRVATIAEEAHQRLAGTVGWNPARVTHVVLQDNTDYAQGVTFVGPQNVIRLWVVAPEPESTLQDFDDWLTLLFVHEYTHLLHLDQTRGLPYLINLLVGHVYHPLQLTPSWLVEGYAVMMESSQTSGGRVRSTLFDMFLRQAVLENNFPRLDQLTNGTRSFPGGNAPYVFGQDFVVYLSERFGPDLMKRLSRQISDDMLPYALNRAFRRETGQAVPELWTDWRHSLEQGYRALAESVSEQGLTPSRQLTHWGEQMGPPRFSADGRSIFFSHTSEDYPEHLWSLDLETGKVRRVLPLAGQAAVAPSLDGRSLYVARADRHRVIYETYDVFRLDLATGREERLSEGRRAVSVDVSPDGRQLAYTAFRQNSSDLWLANSAMEEPRLLLESEPGDQIYQPRFSPDGQRLAISRWRSGGYRDIQLYDLSTQTVTPITDDRALDTAPCFSPDGRWLVFSSDRSGIANLYAYDLEQSRLWQITNVLSGAFQPDLSPDGRRLIFVSYSSLGYDLHVMPFDPTTFRDPAPPPPERRGPTWARPRPRSRERPYRPWGSFAPRSWELGLVSDAFGQALQLGTYSNDATGAHQFDGTMTVGLRRGDVNYDLQYVFRMFRPNLTLRHARWIAPRNSWRVDSSNEPFISETLLASADLSVSLSEGIASHRLSGAYELRYSRSLTDFSRQRWDPSGRPPRFPQLGLDSGVQVAWTFANTRRSPRAISNEGGRILSVSLRLSHPALGSDFFGLFVRYRWSEFLSMPWLRHHVLAFSLNGGIGSSDRNDANFFLGGYPEQDLVQSLVTQSYVGNTVLRGYPPGVIGGNQYHLLNMEYRFPLWNVERGIWTLPFYVSHIWLALTCDVGGAFSTQLNVDELLVGVGGEVLVRLIVGYYLPVTLRFAYARGLMEGGQDMFSAVLGVPF